MRDHTKLKAFTLADALTLRVYETTRWFPVEERFCLAAQMRRSALSVPCNIVEGCGRHTEADFLYHLDMAHGSALELEYQASLAQRLHYLRPEQASLVDGCIEVSKVVNGLIRSLRR
ncbi:MAG TPA: four helix bundle protein [Phycisphaerae bacterium]|nr:four helix bundle protein [Phycisphaerales bacterium]HRX86022.1 four helix bundle protein [Phycisphaerae bacterium]